MMMNPFSTLKDRDPSIFNPKVTPDPSQTERLEARLREAAQRVALRYNRNVMRTRRSFASS